MDSVQDAKHEEIQEKIKIISALQDDLNGQLSAVYAEMGAPQKK